LYDDEEVYGTRRRRRRRRMWNMRTCVRSPRRELGVERLE
jgi:hypothetical protein